MAGVLAALATYTSGIMSVCGGLPALRTSGRLMTDSPGHTTSCPASDLQVWSTGTLVESGTMKIPMHTPVQAAPWSVRLAAVEDAYRQVRIVAGPRQHAVESAAIARQLL